MMGSFVGFFLAACSRERPSPTPTATPRATASPAPQPTPITPIATRTPTPLPSPTPIPVVALDAEDYPFQSPVALHYPEIPPTYQRAIDNLSLDDLSTAALQRIAKDLRFVETATRETTPDEQLMYRSDYVPGDLIELRQSDIIDIDDDGDFGLRLPDDYLIYVDSRLIPTLRRIDQVAVENTVTLLLTNAYRGYEHQEDIYGPADFIAYPGASSHQSGFALDLSMFHSGANDYLNPSTRVVELLLNNSILGGSLIHPFGMADPPHFLALPPTLATLITLAADSMERDYNHLTEQDLTLLQAALYQRLNITVVDGL